MRRFSGQDDVQLNVDGYDNSTVPPAEAVECSDRADRGELAGLRADQPSIPTTRPVDAPDVACFSDDFLAREAITAALSRL